MVESRMSELPPRALVGLLLLVVSQAWAAPARALPPDQPQVPKAADTQATSHTETTGCLAKGSTPTRRKARSSPTASSSIVVQHHFRHACCLKGSVSTTVEDGYVDVVERLSGKGCRCLCTSELRTTIPLPPGKYRLTVRLDDRGTRRNVTMPRLPVVLAPGQSLVVPVNELLPPGQPIPARDDDVVPF